MMRPHTLWMIFDGFRFYKIRQGATAAEQARNQFVTSNDKNLVFGYGKHACPGRFKAAAEIKMIIARILLEYEFNNESDMKERYPSHPCGRMVSAPRSEPSRNLLMSGRTFLMQANRYFLGKEKSRSLVSRG